ncbi:hypothetical protein [Streptomyces sp. NPDC096324]|uniref:hypothetical protein n=1 Tax=Streptomyces sp. NPDC096324 TaxID=3366085 RepID=UPI0038072C56
MIASECLVAVVLRPASRTFHYTPISTTRPQGRPATRCRLAAEEINKAGEELRLLEADCGARPEKAAEEVETLVVTGAVDGVTPGAPPGPPAATPARCGADRSDLSSGMRSQLGPLVATGDPDGASWVSWAELASIDHATVPDLRTARLTWHTKSHPWVRHRQFVDDPWPAEVVSAVGVPPAGVRGATERVEWTTGELVCTYEPLTVGAVLGPDTHWPHVFAVMSALAGRFGDEAVRLVVAFD